MRIWTMAAPLLMLASQASAVNWVTTPASPLGLTSMYDADSVYVEASTGLIYASTCGVTSCVEAAYAKDISVSRYDCDARTVAYDYGRGDWSPPAKRASSEYDMSDNTYKDGTTASEILEAVCALRTSWPRR